jgi:hypothetical protein
MNGVQKRSMKLYQAKSSSAQSRRRHDRDRRTMYFNRIVDEPSDFQRQTIDTLIFLEWSAFVAESEGGLVALREAREHRRLFQKLMVDFEKSLVAKPEPAPKPPTLADYFAAKEAAAE